MTAYHDDSIQPRANLGDLVTIDGYGNRVFRIDALNYEYYRDAEVEHSGIFFETTDVETLELLLADESEVTVISRSEKADNYLRMNIAKPQPRAELPSIDDLLDDLRSAMLIVDIFGESEERRRKIDGIKAQLKDIAEGGVW